VDGSQVESTDAWRLSPERRRHRRGGWLTVVLAVAVGVTSFVLYRDHRITLGYEQVLPGQLPYVALAVATAVVFGLLALFVNLAYRDALQREHAERWQVEEARRRLDRAEQAADKRGPMDLTVLWMVTQRRLDYYHALATSQAERSFRQAQRSVAAGFAVLVVAVAAVAFTGSLVVTITAAAVGVVGAALAALLGRSFLRTHEATAERTRLYFEQPFAFARQLSAERLLILLEAEDRAAAVRDLIRAVMTMPLAPVEPIKRGRHSSVPE
jgi:membrane associated rhomboid family serine protease